MRQSLELIRLHDLEGSVRPTGLGVEYCNELVIHSTHHRSRVVESLVLRVALTEVKKFHKALREGLEIDEELLFALEYVEVLLGAGQLVEEERVTVVSQVHGERLLGRARGLCMQGDFDPQLLREVVSVVGAHAN